MFSGIIEKVGIINSVKREKNLNTLSIVTSSLFKGIKVGESISVDGVCLTLIGRKSHTVIFEVMKETIEATTLKNIKRKDKVNLERALTFNSRINGHFVSGHVDGVGVIDKKTNLKNYVEYRIKVQKSLVRYIVPKGSISIDGISLTVGKVGKDWFSVYIIPHTLKVTTLKNKGVKSLVNVETDLLAKYVLQSK